MSNQQIAQRPKFSVAIQTEKYQKLIHDTLKDPRRAQRFIASISSAVAINPALQECDAGTILSCALLGESLELSPSPQLGQYYMVPFQDRKAGRTVATFILGYKGYIQLAIRSAQYRRLNVIAVKEGELVYWDPLTEEIDLRLIQDELERETAKTIGYCAAMAFKTMLRQLISKWGVMSIEMRTSVESDESPISEDGTPDYLTPEEDPPLEPTQPPEAIPALPSGESSDGQQSFSLDDL